MNLGNKTNCPIGQSPQIQILLWAHLWDHSQVSWGWVKSWSQLPIGQGLGLCCGDWKHGRISPGPQHLQYGLQGAWVCLGLPCSPIHLQDPGDADAQRVPPGQESALWHFGLDWVWVKPQFLLLWQALTMLAWVFCSMKTMQNEPIPAFGSLIK